MALQTRKQVCIDKTSNGIELFFIYIKDIRGSKQKYQSEIKCKIGSSLIGQKSQLI